MASRGLQIAGLGEEISNLRHRIGGMDTDPHGKSFYRMGQFMDEIVEMQGRMLSLLATSEPEATVSTEIQALAIACYKLGFQTRNGTRRVSKWAIPPELAVDKLLRDFSKGRAFAPHPGAQADFLNSQGIG
jgi:hypothetical protein